MRTGLRWILFTLALTLPLGCSGGGLPEGLAATPNGSGPTVRWDLEAEPLPDIPLPNDIATWPDPGSPTGLRINASLIAPSGFERRLRLNFDRLDGWSTTGPISISFDEPLDVPGIVGRHGPSRLSSDDFAEHALYLIDLTTGVPVPLDIGTRRIPRAVASPNGYFVNDPRAGSSNVLFETVDEDLNRNGRLDPQEDSDFDGVLDAPNTPDGRLFGFPFEDVDRITWWYERATNTLTVRPLIPLAEERTYAVVITDRIRGIDGQPVRSPFESINHLSQTQVLSNLPRIFSDRPHIYGDLAERGFSGVSFTWAFTTQSVRGDLRALRAGLYGTGPFARLQEEYEAELVPYPVRGGSRGFACDPPANRFIATSEELRTALRSIPLDDFGVPAEQVETVLEAFEASVSHIAYGFYESPYLLGVPGAESPDDVWQIDRLRGEAEIRRDRIPMLIVVPRENEAHQQPFATTMYVHGYGGVNAEALAFAAQTAAHGIATVAIDLPGHGLNIVDGLEDIVTALLAQECLAPLGQGLVADRAYDLNGDGSADSAGLFLSAYMFHTRDSVRQSVLDVMQGIRVVRSFQGAPGQPENRLWTSGSIQLDPRTTATFDGDVSGDGEPDVAGDFDGDGTPDLGGYDRPFRLWGSSLGGIISMVTSGVEPSVVATVPVSGGGLLDTGLRGGLSGVRIPVWLRLMGPIVASEPSAGPSGLSACQEGVRSIYFLMPDLQEETRTEIACVEEGALGSGDVVVVTNLNTGERRCGGADAEGRIRIGFPSNTGDALSIAIYNDARNDYNFASCSVRAGVELRSNDVIDTWRNGNGSGPGECSTCARYRERVFEAGSTLVAPVEGMGMRRQSPDLRRFVDLAHMAVDPAEPVNYARGLFLEPIETLDVEHGQPRSVLVMNTAGDTTVPVSGGNAFARAAGILAFLPPDAPDELAEYRAPEDFIERYGWESPDDVLVDLYVLEGLSRLDRHRVPGTTAGFVYDVDDMSAGRQFFDPTGQRQIGAGGVRPPRLSPPLRWGRESRPLRSPRGTATLWRTTGDHPGYSAVLNVVGLPVGQHVLFPPDSNKQFDEGEYLLNTIGWYLASEGHELAWTVLSDPFCLERSTCQYGLDP